MGWFTAVEIIECAGALLTKDLKSVAATCHDRFLQGQMSSCSCSALTCCCCLHAHCHIDDTLHFLLAVLEQNQNGSMCACMHFNECCLQTMTMKKIRHQLNAIFGVDLSERKDFLGAQVGAV